jgi:hypothetical protein
VTGLTEDDDPDQVGIDWFSYMMVTGESSGGPDCDSMFVYPLQILCPSLVQSGSWVADFLLLSGLGEKTGIKSYEKKIYTFSFTA